MASSEAMDDSFRARVEKIFGSLTSSSSSSSSSSTSSSSSSSSELPSSLQPAVWSLTDDAVERKEWRRGAGGSDRDEIPCASAFDELKKDRRKNFWIEKADDLDDLDGYDNKELNRSRRGGGDDVDEWEIRSSIGLDRTLDNEEEEDEFDKVASGRENAGERLYMKDVTDQGSYLNFHNVLPKSLHSTKDLRANHLAAKIRLQEDEADAQKLNSRYDCDTEAQKPSVKASKYEGGQLKSILKRKGNNLDSKSNKRVRFDPACEVVCGEAEEAAAAENSEDIFMGASPANAVISDDGCTSGDNVSGVPDYLRNPSKYTRYSFDSTSELDEKSNTQGFLDFLKLIKRSKPTESGSGSEDASTDLPKSVTFIPKKKAFELKAASNSSEVKQDDDSNFPVGIAAGECQQSEVCVMEEDGPETEVVNRSAGLQKPGRRYRTKPSSDDCDA